LRIFVETIALRRATGYFFTMEKSGALALKLAGLVVAGALLERMGATKFLWVFPLVFPGLGAWLLFTCVDIFIARASWPTTQRIRLLLWSAGLLFFSAQSGYPLVGIFLIFAPAVMWVLSQREKKLLLRFSCFALLLLFLLGHDQRFFHWQLQEEPDLGWRFSFHLIALFAFFRACSWLAAVCGREEKPDFFATMEYFISPVFWLSPLHASHLVWERMKAGRADEAQAFLWIFRALFHSLCLSIVSAYAFPWLNGLYSGGLHHVQWFEWVLVGPAVFLIAYLDKSQVSYLTAGMMRLAGKDIEPDFRSPWFAHDLLDYWRRFHYWLWEFYMNVVYPLLLLPLARRLKPQQALPLALFLAFSLGTGMAHFLSYRASLLASLALGAIFGFATVMHYFMRGLFKDARIGIPATWSTVFLLYVLAYPVFGLGWGLAEFSQFFGS
jgi:hypothetical protein